MAQNAPVVITPPQLPEGYTPDSWQEYANKCFALASAYLPGAYNTINHGSTTPSVEDRDKPWFRTTDGRWYFYNNGVWCSRHSVPASGSERSMWTGTLANLNVYDGGADVGVTETTGPFWEEDTDFQAKIPIGPGDLPSTTAIAVGDTGGVETVTLSVDELKHKHVFGAVGNNDDIKTLRGDPTVIEETDTHYTSGGGSTSVADTTVGNLITAVGFNTTDDNDEVTIMPPYRGIYLIKRTARVYYTI